MKAKRKKPVPSPERRAQQPGPLLYKVVELSTVDEGALESTINEWVPQGWTLDGVQFAMRESSRRPSMAFVFFTREGEPTASERGRAAEDAERRLRNLAGDRAKMPVAVSAWERLAQLAGDDEA